MRKNMQVKHNVMTNLELNHMIGELGNLGKEYPIYEKNVHKKLPDDWKWADSICKLNVPGLKHCIVRYVISVNSKDIEKNIIGFHTDSDVEGEKTIILYLQGDLNTGGQIQVEDETYDFRQNAMFIMDSHLIHRAMPYWGEKTRLAIKWRWTSEG